MIAVIETGSKQYMVAEGDLVSVEKLAGNAGDKVTFDKVLLVGDPAKADAVEVGAPMLDGKKVEAEIVEQDRDEKVMVVKYKNKTRQHSRRGHRQMKTKVEIKKIV